MRSTMILAAIALIAGGGIGARYATAPGRESDAFATKYLSVAQQNPDIVTLHIADILPECLPEKARAYVRDPGVLRLAAKTFMKSIMLMAENKAPEQMSGEIVPYIIKESKGMSEAQQKNFTALSGDGLRDREAMFCVMSAVRKSIDQRMDIIATEWPLRS